MNLDQLFKKLSHGTLSDLAITGEASGKIPVPSYPKLAFRLNEALKALYARFPLDERAVIIETVTGIYEYKLHPDFSQLSPSAEPIKYLKDTVAHPFEGDVLMITDVHDNAHKELPLNDRRDPLSWFTKANTSLVMDYPVTGVRYNVSYRKGPKLVSEDPEELVDNLEDIEFEIPVQLETALVHHIASGVYSGMSMDTAMAKATAHMEKYEAECIFHENKNTFNGSSADTNIRPMLGGFI